MDALELIRKIGKKESNLLKSEFVAPISKGQMIKVKIDGLCYNFKPIKKDREREGWFVFKPVNSNEAKIIRDVDIYQLEEQKNIFHKIRIILASKTEDEQWVGFFANYNKTVEQINKDFVIVKNVDGAQIFDTIVAIYDGVNFWFLEQDFNSNLEVSDYLRESLQKNELDTVIRYKGLTPEQKKTYAFCYEWKKHMEIEQKKQTIEGRIIYALEHAEATLNSYVERGDILVINWVSKKGERYSSTIDKETFVVQRSGVCLNGTDSNFDLAALVSVMVEREKLGYNGPGFDDDEYDDDDDW